MILVRIIVSCVFGSLGRLWISWIGFLIKDRFWIRLLRKFWNLRQSKNPLRCLGFSSTWEILWEFFEVCWVFGSFDESWIASHSICSWRTFLLHDVVRSTVLRRCSWAVLQANLKIHLVKNLRSAESLKIFLSFMIPCESCLMYLGYAFWSLMYPKFLYIMCATRWRFLVNDVVRSTLLRRHACASLCTKWKIWSPLVRQCWNLRRFSILWDLEDSFLDWGVFVRFV